MKVILEKTLIATGSMPIVPPISELRGIRKGICVN